MTPRALAAALLLGLTVLLASCYPDRYDGWEPNGHSHPSGDDYQSKKLWMAAGVIGVVLVGGGVVLWRRAER